jgi:hypothetical protein
MQCRQEVKNGWAANRMGTWSYAWQSNGALHAAGIMKCLLRFLVARRQKGSSGK